MIIKEFKPDEKFEKNSVIIADYRNVNYEDEGNTIQDAIADKYGIDLYPIICGVTEGVKIYLGRYYGDCIWYVDKSLIGSFI